MERVDQSWIPSQILEDGKFLSLLYSAMAFSSVALLGKENVCMTRGRFVPLHKMVQV